MKNWTIARRILFVNGVLLAFLLIVGCIGSLALWRIERLSIQSLQKDAVPGMMNMSEASTQMLRGHINLLTVAIEEHGEDRTEAIAALEASDLALTKALELYDKTISVPFDRDNFVKLMGLRAAYEVRRTEIINLAEKNLVAEMRDAVAHKLEPLFLVYRNHINEMLRWNVDSASTATDAVIASASRARQQAVWIAGLSVLIALVIAARIIRSINHALQEMAENLDDAATQLASAAGQVSSSSQSLAQGASEQAASLEETSASLEEVSSMTKRNAQNANSVRDLSGQARQATEGGVSGMQAMSRSMEGIRHAASEMRTSMDGIKNASSDVSKIIKTIDEIAFQTNLLALNAAVEAARAGEAGAGFAVVADEVRNLAQRSAKAARETTDMIEASIKRSEQGSAATEKVVVAIEDVASKAGGVERHLSEILAKSRQMDEQVGQIATASGEQSQGISQVSTAVTDMDKITQSNASSAEETAAAAEELNAQSASLQHTVSQLRQLVGGGKQSSKNGGSREEPMAPFAARASA